MQLCQAILTPIEVIVTALIRIVREIVRTVCESVVTVVRTVREVTERVCRWLPWPLNKLCDLVTRIIEVFEEVVEWICREVIDRIISWIEILIRYVFYLIRWICWIIDWIPRFILDFLPCLVGIKVRKGIRLRIKILRYGDSDAETVDTVQRHIRVSNAVLAEECNVELNVLSIEFLDAPDNMKTFDCGAAGLFSAQHVFFDRNQERDAGALSPTITVYYIEDITNARGCHIPRTDYVVLDQGASDDSLAHELGHAGDLTHSADVTNLMNVPARTASNLSRSQCCLIRSSRIASVVNALI
jgi:hypothetical protein